LLIWFVIYHYLQPITQWFVFNLLGMTRGEPLAEAIFFFIYEFPKVMLLLVLIIFLVGIIRTYFTPETHSQSNLKGKRH